MHFWSLANFAAFGVCWRRIGTPAPHAEISALVAAPHSTFLDVMIALLVGRLSEIPYAVSRVENYRIPVIGRKLNALIHSIVFNCVYGLLWHKLLVCQRSIIAVVIAYCH